jgi:YegS/Rv2252/BmrU family lipid kinase
VVEGYDVVVAAGGDGTVHEVINGMLSAGLLRSKFGTIPIGTGNDFAYSYAIPVEIPLAVERLFRNQTRFVDLGEVVDDRGQRRFFANNLGIGFDANVVIRVESITRLHGFPKYFWGVLKTLALDFRPFSFQMRFDAEELEEEVLFVAFGLGVRHGGGFMLTPSALNDDDRIDSCTVRTMSRIKALRFLNSAVNGTHIHNPLVKMRQNKSIEISCIDALPIHIDGEVFAFPKDNVHHISVTSLPKVLQVLV